LEEEGIVVELKGQTAVVRMDAGGCEGCGSAGICKTSGDDRMLMAENRAGASVGQRVVVDVESGAFLRASLIVYMTPVLFLFFGAWVGDRFGASVVPGMSEDFYQAVGGMIFLVLSVVAVRMYGNWTKKSPTVKPFVAKVVN